MGLFYVGAGFWKINTSFLSPRVSCGSVYVASMLYFLPPSLTPTWFVKPLLAAGGVVTVVAELGLGLCLMSWNSKAQRCGIVMAAVLHYLIAISPYPNQIPGFGVFCVTRMFHAMPNAWHAALHEAISLPTTTRAAAVHFAAAALVAVSTMATDTGREGPSDHIDWCIPAQTFLCLVGIRAIILDSTVGETWRKKAFLAAKKAKKVSAPAASLLLRVGGWGMFLATTMYVFEFQALGLMDISAVSHPWISCSPSQVALIHFAYFRVTFARYHRFLKFMLMAAPTISSCLPRSSRVGTARTATFSTSAEESSVLRTAPA